VVKDTTYYSNGSSQLVYLRPDYGSTWEGNFIIENVHCYVPPNKQFNVFLHSFSNWYFGYKCHIPSVEIKDIYVYNNKTGELFDSSFQYLYMYSKIANAHMHKDKLTSGAENANPIGAPEYIKITSNPQNYQFRIPYNTESDSFLSGVKFYSGNTEVKYAQGTQGCFTFY